MNMNRKTSPIWISCTKEEFSELIKKSKTFTEALAFFGLGNKGNNYRTLRERMDYENVQYAHLYENIYRKKEFGKKTPIQNILVEGSKYSRPDLKRRLLEENLLENRCSVCGLMPEWEGMSLVMILDHINGISNDNRLSNLRFICPNCNSQTKTFSGRNVKRPIDPNKICKCGNKKWVLAKLCKECSGIELRKCEHPTKEQLAEDICTLSWVAIGKKYGVSDSACKKWARKYGLIV